MPEQRPTRESIIKAWKGEDKKSARPVGAKQVARAMKISVHWIRKLFPEESLTEMKRQNNIRISKQEQHHSAEALLQKLDDVVTRRRTLPAWAALIHRTGISEKTWKKTLGGRAGCAKEDVYRAYHQWLCAKHKTSANIAIVERFLNRPSESDTTPGAIAVRNREPGATKSEGPVYGAPLNYRNVTYAPTNELGVVLLFGMVSKALSFESIQRVGPDFPDCEALRRVRGGQLQRKLIEFEYKSREFNHDPNGCNVIVCWEHNWKECPSSLEVIELSKEIERLKCKAGGE
jgi:hypothetical protein